MEDCEHSLNRRNVSMKAHGCAALNAGLWQWYFTYYFTFSQKGSQGF